MKLAVVVVILLVVAFTAAWFACEFGLLGGSECLALGGVLGFLTGLVA